MEASDIGYKHNRNKIQRKMTN